MLILIFMPIMIALAIYLVRKENFIKFAIISNIFEIILIGYLLNLVIKYGDNLLIIGGYSSEIGISLLLKKSNGILLLAFSIIWLITTIYSFEKWGKDYKFNFFLHFLRGTFYGLILSNDLFNIFIFIEITSIISGILIIYRKDGFSIRAGIYYLLFNSIGMIFYLLGIIIIYTSIGSLDLAQLVNLEMNLLNKFAIALIFVSLGLKSAFFPVYNWLPKAHASAPSSISALLSGVLVKTGFIVLLKITNYISLKDISSLIIYVGVSTAIIGFVFAISQKDIKKILAFHTISQSGIILIGFAGAESLRIGGVLHIINHAFFKTLLFLAVGIIIEKYKIRRVDKLQGVFKQLPVVSIALIIGMFSISGLPYTSGYVSKSIIKTFYKNNILMASLFHLINLGTVVSFIKVSSILFKTTHNTEIKSTFKRNIPIIIIGMITVSLGLVEINLLEKYLDISVYVSIKSFITYGVYLSIGYILYKYVISKDIYILKKIRRFKLNFRNANALLLGFIVITILAIL